MAPRTRRAAAQKQNQYRIPDEDEDDPPSTPPGKSNVGGILAALNQNVPAVKSRKTAKKSNAEINRTETLPSSDEFFLRTPPPPTSVLVGKNHDICSPLTQPRVTKARLPPKVVDRSLDDNSTVISCESFSPVQKSRLPRNRKPRKVIDDESSDEDGEETVEIHAEDEEDDTAEMDEEEDDENDPNETILESDASGESGDDVESEGEQSDEEVESETEDDEYEPEDDEYVPDEEEDESIMDEDLNSYIEEEDNKGNSKSRSRNRKSMKRKSDPEASLKNSNINQSDSETVLSENPDGGNDMESVQSIESNNNSCDAGNCIPHCTTTPKNAKSSSTLLDASPEPEVAVIVDDDDDYDDDVLVATILDNNDDDITVKVVNQDDGNDDLLEEEERNDCCDVDLTYDDDDDVDGPDASEDVDDSSDVNASQSQGGDKLHDRQREKVDDSGNHRRTIEATRSNDMKKASASSIQSNTALGTSSSGERSAIVSSATIIEDDKDEALPKAQNISATIQARRSNDMKGDCASSIQSNTALGTSASVERSAIVSTEAVIEDEKDKILPNAQNIYATNEMNDQFTPKKKSKKSRRSFFRVDGMVKRGKWKLGSKIGVGSFGVVHVGMNNETGKLMAVKKFKVDEAVMKDIRSEVDLMKSLNHPNIVQYLGAQMDKTHLHIFQEWVPGGSVATLLSRFGPFSLLVIRSYLSQTLAGLAYLHENDIMHRDIKGSNILVNDEGVVKLADFGASKKLSNLRANLMMSLTVRGTPYFMSPEVFEEKYSAKADIWGIGCVAYQMITGSPPWKDKGFSNPISLFNYIKRHTGPPTIADEHKERLLNEDRSFYHWLNNLLESCFSKDPTARPDAADLLQHQFFTEMHDEADDDSICSRGLFSPASVLKSTPKFGESPGEESQMAESPSSSELRSSVPTPTNHVRSKSVVQWRTTFSSPPKPKASARNDTKADVKQSPNRARSFRSPRRDTSNWPDWARAEIQKRNLFEKSPNNDPCLGAEERNLSALMGSLALSEDSETVSDNPYRRASHSRISTVGTASEESKLVGLSILNDSNITYEI